MMQVSNRFIDSVSAESIGKRLRTIRGRESQARFAKSIGIAQSSLSRWERGEGQDIEVMNRICELCSVDPRWLFTGEGTAPAGVDDDAADLHAESDLESQSDRPRSAEDRPLEHDEIREALMTRIRQVMGRLGGVEALSERSGLSRRALGEILGGARDPTASQIAAIAKAGPVSNDWLLTGVERDGDTVYVQIRSARPAAGAGSTSDADWIVGTLPLSGPWARSLGPLENLSAVRVRGDSMEPTLSDGDDVLVDVAVGQPKRDGLWVLDVRSELKVKRLEFLASGALRIVSDSPKYQPEIVPPDQVDGVRLVGRVLRSWKKEG